MTSCGPTPSCRPRSTFARSTKRPRMFLNRILWRAMRGSAEPYPAWAAGAEDEEEEDEESLVTESESRASSHRPDLTERRC